MATTCQYARLVWTVITAQSFDAAVAPYTDNHVSVHKASVDSDHSPVF